MKKREKSGINGRWRRQQRPFSTEPEPENECTPSSYGSCLCCLLSKNELNFINKSVQVMTFRNHVKMMMMLLHVCIYTAQNFSRWICLSMLNVSCVRAVLFWYERTYESYIEKRLRRRKKHIIAHKNPLYRTRGKSRIEKQRKNISNWTKKMLRMKCFKRDKNIFNQRKKRNEKKNSQQK